jgi:D-inositol-3-phosphate glycosyltransferase
MATKQRIDELKEELRRAELARAAAEAELEAMRRTRTFRYTAPARALVGLFRHRPSERGAVDAEPPQETPIHSHIEKPAKGAVVAPYPVEVRGWLASRSGRPVRIEVFVDGREVGRARLGLPTPYLAGDVDSPEATLGGFEATVDLRPLPPERDETTIELVAVALGGERHRLEPVSVRVDRQAPQALSRPASAPKLAPRLPDVDVRLLVFTHNLELGGAQLYLLELLTLLSREPDLAAVLVAGAGGVLREPTEALGIPVVIGSAPLDSSFRYGIWQRGLEAWAPSGGFNAAFANTLSAFPGADLAQQLDLPTVWAIHESCDLASYWEVFHPIEVVEQGVRERAGAALGSAAALIFEAEATRCLFLPNGDARRLVTWPYGIDVEKIDTFAASLSPEDARRRLGLPLDARIFLCLGTIEPRKAQAGLAQAFREIVQSHPEAMLALVGSRSDAYAQLLHTYIRDAGLEDEVVIAPLTEEPNLWLRAADALVCPSDVESLPRVILEAMALSVPVIASRVFGIPETIEDGETGYLFGPRDNAALAAALRRFLATPHTDRERVAASASSRVRERHDHRRYASAVHGLLRSLVADPRALPPRDVQTFETAT